MDLSLTPHPDKRITNECSVRWDGQLIGYCYTETIAKLPQHLRLITRVTPDDGKTILEWVNQETGVTHCGISQPPPLPPEPEEMEADTAGLYLPETFEDDDEQE